jgi:hypothetical protein
LINEIYKDKIFIIMNIKVFKKLIKEAVIDAIHEELPYILE